MAKAPDRWHRWLMDVRFGGDPAARERALTEFLYPVRDTALDKAKLQPGDTVLDVGTGDGLIAFGALERLSPSGHVIFSDISQDLLDHCRAAAAAEGLLDRCRFVLSSADSLADIADASVDVVTTRSVLIYVKDKAMAALPGITVQQGIKDTAGGQAIGVSDDGGYDQLLIDPVSCQMIGIRQLSTGIGPMSIAQVLASGHFPQSPQAPRRPHQGRARPVDHRGEETARTRLPPRAP
jgi:SAM-dependent methyltransferase